MQIYIWRAEAAHKKFHKNFRQKSMVPKLLYEPLTWAGWSVDRCRRSSRDTDRPGESSKLIRTIFLACPPPKWSRGFISPFLFTFDGLSWPPLFTRYNGSDSLGCVQHFDSMIFTRLKASSDSRRLHSWTFFTAEVEVSSASLLNLQTIETLRCSYRRWDACHLGMPTEPPKNLVTG